MQICAIIAAAGSGKRLGTLTPKQYLPLAGKPVLAHSLIRLNSHPLINSIVVVVGDGWEQYVRELANEYGVKKIGAVVTGGQNRQESVFEGLLSVPRSTKITLIHDGARPFITAGLITRTIDAASGTGAAIPVISVKDTIKMIRPQGCVLRTLDRSQLAAVQTPQAFLHGTILQAHEKAAGDKFIGTDDAMLVERLGLPVSTVHGEDENIKITTALDLQIAEWMLMNNDKRGN